MRRPFSVNVILDICSFFQICCCCPPSLGIVFPLPRPAGRTQSMKIDDRKSNRSIDANRLIGIDCHRMPSIPIDHRFHRLGTPWGPLVTVLSSHIMAAARQLPETFRKLVITKLSTNYREAVELKTVPMLQPGPNELLIKNRWRKQWC